MCLLSRQIILDTESCGSLSDAKDQLNVQLFEEYVQFDGLLSTVPLSDAENSFNV